LGWYSELANVEIVHVEWGTVFQIVEQSAVVRKRNQSGDDEEI